MYVKVATGGALLVEVFCSFPLLFPIVNIRRFAVVLQVLISSSSSSSWLLKPAYIYVIVSAAYCVTVDPRLS